MSKYLFIGGPKDGEHLDISDRYNQWMVREIDNTLYDCKFGDSEFITYLKFDYTDYVYIKRYLSSVSGMIPVFVYEKVPDVVTTLLKGYRKRKTAKKKTKFY